MTTADATWVFGYGSLVSPESMARTIGRRVERDDGFAIARLDGYGRRWNYGSLHQRGDWSGPHGSVTNGIVVSLGLELSSAERSNGVVVRVTEDELAMLDWRERDYERTDVTDRIRMERESGRVPCPGRVVTYVPRCSAIERYQVARNEKRAAIRSAYVELVETAFVELSDGQLDEYRASTSIPDVPVLDFS